MLLQSFQNCGDSRRDAIKKAGATLRQFFFHSSFGRARGSCSIHIRMGNILSGGSPSSRVQREAPAIRSHADLGAVTKNAPVIGARFGSFVENGSNSDIAPGWFAVSCTSSQQDSFDKKDLITLIDHLYATVNLANRHHNTWYTDEVLLKRSFQRWICEQLVSGNDSRNYPTAVAWQRWHMDDPDDRLPRTVVICAFSCLVREGHPPLINVNKNAWNNTDRRVFLEAIAGLQPSQQGCENQARELTSDLLLHSPIWGVRFLDPTVPAAELREIVEKRSRVFTAENPSADLNQLLWQNFSSAREDLLAYGGLNKHAVWNVSYVSLVSGFRSAPIFSDRDPVAKFLISLALGTRSRYTYSTASKRSTSRGIHLHLDRHSLLHSTFALQTLTATGHRSYKDQPLRPSLRLVKPLREPGGSSFKGHKISATLNEM